MVTTADPVDPYILGSRELTIVTHKKNREDSFQKWCLSESSPCCDTEQIAGAIIVCSEALPSPLYFVISGSV